MKKGWVLKNLILMFLILLFSFAMFKVVTHAVFSPNYAKSTELDDFRFKGYVQIQPSFRENRNGGVYHAYQGGFKYSNTSDNEWYWTSQGMGPQDSRILSREKIILDSLNPFAPVATFYKEFRWAQEGDWPSAQPMEPK